MVKATNLTDIDRNRIAEAVRGAETQTSVEICLVLAKSSSQYQAFEIIYPALLALAAGGAAAVFHPALAAISVFAVQGAVFVVGALILQWRPLRIALVPPKIKRQAAWRRARLSYAGLGLQNVRTKNAVLVFCSAAERYVEILTDDAVVTAVPQETWTGITDRFAKQFAKGDKTDAFVQAAAACAETLAVKFPPDPGRANQLPDQLTEI